MVTGGGVLLLAAVGRGAGSGGLFDGFAEKSIKVARDRTVRRRSGTMSVCVDASYYDTS